jgi:hypothetical protein
MARLRNPPKDTLRHNLLDHDKTRLALEWLQENPSQKPTAAARIFNIKDEKDLQQKWRRTREKIVRKKPVQHGGQNKILRPEQHKAMIQYSIDHATGGGKGATKQMMYNCAMWLRA